MGEMKMVKQIEDDKADILQALMNSSRLQLLTFIEKNEKANVSQLSKAVNLDRSTVVYHMSLLNKVGLVTEQTIPIRPAHSTGIMGRYFSVNKEKLRIAVALLRKEISGIAST
jgi:DNA-binding transcriptional ArsR family regulator